MRLHDTGEVTNGFIGKLVGEEAVPLAFGDESFTDNVLGCEDIEESAFGNDVVWSVAADETEHQVLNSTVTA